MRKAIVLILFISQLLYSQTGIVRGLVKNQSTGEPVIGAVVLIEGTSLGTTTDRLGWFEIKGVPPGRYNLVVSALDFEVKRVEIYVLSEEISYVNVELGNPKVGDISKGRLNIGYAEIAYEDYLSEPGPGFAVLRFAPYLGYKIADKIMLNSRFKAEIEEYVDYISDAKPKVHIEFFYIDFILNKRFNLKFGLFLLPTSKLNEYHEPTSFFGAFRPIAEEIVIPTGWREIGIMFYGTVMRGLSYKLALVNGLRTDSFYGWIGLRSQEKETFNFNKLAGILRIDFEISKGLNLGSSFYYGGGGEREENATFKILTSEVLYQSKNLFMKGLFAYGDADYDYPYYWYYYDKIRVNGWYVEAGYNLIPLINPDSKISFSPFIRYEGYHFNFWGLEDNVLTFGVDFKPVPQIVFKAGYRRSSSYPKSGLFNLGFGVTF